MNMAELHARLTAHMHPGHKIAWVIAMVFVVAAAANGTIIDVFVMAALTVVFIVTPIYVVVEGAPDDVGDKREGGDYRGGWE